MDKFGVPKKVNRHVLKAMYLMNSKGRKSSKHFDIMRVVRTTMKTNVPRHLSVAVQNSLKNMARLGVIRRHGCSFSIYKKKTQSNIVNLRNLMNQRIAQGNVPINPLPANHKQKEEYKNRLDPNLKRRRPSECSSSENDIERSRKRFNTNRPFVKKGNAVFLPRARMSPTCPGKTMETSYNDYINRRVLPIKKLKFDLSPNSRKRRNPESSPDCASKKKRYLPSKPTLRKRRRIATKPRVPRNFNLSGQDELMEMRKQFNKNAPFKRIKNNPVAKNIEPLYDDDDNIGMIDAENEMRLQYHDFPETTEHNEASDISIVDRNKVVTAKQRRSRNQSHADNIEPLYDENDDITIIEPQFREHENQDHNEESHASLGRRSIGLAAQQSPPTSQCSVRKVYKSKHFFKNSNIEIGSNQEKNESESVVSVRTPNSEHAVDSVQKADGQPNKSISPKIMKVDIIDYYT